jgi:replicative DNA helicase
MTKYIDENKDELGVVPYPGTEDRDKKLGNMVAELEKKGVELTDEHFKVSEAQMETDKWAQYEGPDRVIHAKDLLDEVKAANEGRKLWMTKIKRLDEITGGFVDGQLIIVSAPTGAGKTSFCQSLTEAFHEQDGKVLWFTYEVGIEEFSTRMPAGMMDFYIPKTNVENNIAWLEQRIIESIAKYGTKVVFIDHLHYLLEMSKLAEAKSTSLLIGMMLRELKKIAINRKIIIFLVSHMKKTESSRTEPPELEDLRDSSFVAQESDIVLMLWRNKDRKDAQGVDAKGFTTTYRGLGNSMSNDTQIAVRKNRRTGNLGGVVCTYTADHRFVEKGEISYDTEDLPNYEQALSVEKPKRTGGPGVLPFA